MKKTITVAPYQLVHTHYASEGKCMRCGSPVGVGFRYYRNLLTGEEVSTHFRSGCSCRRDSDPYKGYDKPLLRNIGTREESHWLYPFWDKQKQKWVLLSQSDGEGNVDRYISLDRGDTHK